jgi:hypothetical protein
MYETHLKYGTAPEWGPAKHDPDSPTSQLAQRQALQAALDLRDGGGPRPDDN